MDANNERQMRFSKQAQLLVDLMKKENPDIENVISDWWLKSKFNIIGSSHVLYYIERILRM